MRLIKLRDAIMRRSAEERASLRIFGDAVTVRRLMLQFQPEDVAYDGWAMKFMDVPVVVSGGDGLFDGGRVYLFQCVDSFEIEKH